MSKEKLIIPKNERDSINDLSSNYSETKIPANSNILKSLNKGKEIYQAYENSPRPHILAGTSSP